MEKKTFTFQLGPVITKIKFVFAHPNPFKVAPSALKQPGIRRQRYVSFADQALLNYVVDHAGDDPEWFTQCGDQFQSISLSKTHGLTESFTLEGRELWGKLNHSTDYEKVEWSGELRPAIEKLEMLDRNNVRVGSEKKRVEIAMEETKLRVQEIRQKEQEAKANAKAAKESSRAQLLKLVKPRKETKMSTGLRLK